MGYGGDLMKAVKCNCSNYCYLCVSQHPKFIDAVTSITDKAIDFIATETQKKTRNDLWQDSGITCYEMENAINEAVSVVLFNSMSPAEIAEITE